MLYLSKKISIIKYKKMKTSFSLIIALFFSFSSVFAQKNMTTLISSSENETVLSFKLNSFKFKTVKTQNGEELTVTADNLSSILEKGAPDLPKFTKSIIIPDKGSTKIDIIYSDFYELQNINIAPSKGNFTRDKDPASIPYEYGKSYTKDSFFPNNLTKLNKPYILRDFRGQAVHVYPFSYNPITKILRVYKEITIKISYLKEKGQNEFTRTSKLNKIAKEFKNIYSKHFINFESQTKYTPVEEIGNMLIICNDAWTDDVQPLVDWKNKIGRHCEMVTVTQAGGTANAIKTYVQNYYNTNGLTFLLLVGDSQQVPTLSSNGDSDNAYAYVTGNDHYLEFFVGRFSAETPAHVQTQVQRTITYENGSTLASGWLNKTMGIASALGAGQGDDDEADYEHVRNMQTDLIGFTYVSPTVEQFDGSQGGNDASGDPTGATVSTELNTGVGNALYCGHGGDFSWVSSGFDVSDINNLTNDNKLPFIFDVACVNGNFVGQTCFGEAWLRAENGGQPTGAIAIVASTINQDWAQPMVAEDEMVDILVESYANNIKRTFTGVAVNGMFLMNDETSDWSMTDTWTTFGDPSVMLRTDNPANMNVTYTSAIIMGQSSFTVNCDFNGALVCLSKDGIIIGTATVTSGSADVPISGLIPGNVVDVAVTGFNKITYLSTISVIAPNGPYVAFDELQVGGESTMNFGQTGNLDITLKNLGPDEATAVTATVTTNDSYVTSFINNTNVSFGNIAGNNGTATSSNSFTVKLANNVPDQHVVNFSIEITSTNKTVWNGTFNLTVNAPALTVGNITVDDSGSGNDDGILDPNETADIIVVTNNEGHADVTNIIGNLAITGTNLVINTATTSAYNLAQGGTANAVFNVTANDVAAGTGETLNFSMTAGADNQYSAAKDFNLVIGFVPEYCDAGADNTTDEFIQRVQFGTIDNSSTQGPSYSDYTDISTNVTVNESYTITITNGEHFSSDQMGCWVDWNYDGDFDDSNETFVISYSGKTLGTGTGTITVPSDAIIGTTTMRLRVLYTGNLSPCGNTSYGEVEDYSLNVIPSITQAGFLTCENSSICIGSNTGNLTLSNNSGTITSWEKRLEGGSWTTINHTDATYSEIISTSGVCEFRVEVDGSVYSNVVSINVLENPAASFTFTQNNQEVTFTNTSSNANSYLWEFGDGNTATIENPVHVYDATNSYNVVLTASNSACDDNENSQTINVNYLGVAKIKENLSIYPNPNIGVFYVSLGDLNVSKTEISVFSVNGKTIYNSKCTSNIHEVDLRNTAKGIYFIKIKSENEIFTDKLILK